MKLLGLFTSTDQLDDLAQCNIYIEQAQAAERSAKIWIIPQILNRDLVGRKEAGKVIQGPGIHPRENYQKGPDLKREDSERRDPQPSPQAGRPWPCWQGGHQG